MGITSFPENINKTIIKLLDKNLRYRCLILQTDDPSILYHISNKFEVLANHFEHPYQILSFLQLFDNVGAHSCSEIIKRIEAIAESSLLLLEGPLHFLNYWTNTSQSKFWGYLSTFTQGPGIIILELVSDYTFQEDFHALSKSACGGVLYWKSRLALSESKKS